MNLSCFNGKLFLRLKSRYQRCDMDLNKLHLLITIEFVMNNEKRDLCYEFKLFQREII